MPFAVNTFSGTEIFRRLKAHECSIAITGVQPTADDFIFEKFFYDPLELICPISYGIRSPISLRQLKTLPLIIRTEKSGLMQFLLKALKKANLRIEDMNVIMEVYGNSDVLQAVALGSGVGFVTRSLLAISGQYNNVAPIQVKRFRVDRYLHLVRAKEGPFYEGERQFWAYALQTRWRTKNFPYNTVN